MAAAVAASGQEGYFGVRKASRHGGAFAARVWDEDIAGFGQEFVWKNRIVSDPADLASKTSRLID